MPKNLFGLIQFGWSPPKFLNVNHIAIELIIQSTQFHMKNWEKDFQLDVDLLTLGNCHFLSEPIYHKLTKKDLTRPRAP